MKNIKIGLLAGLIYAVIDILPILAISIPDKTAVIAAAFINRFAIGFLIPTTNLYLPYWLQGIILGFFLSLPGAIVIKTYVPIIGAGIVGGLIIGVITQKLLGKKVKY